jgi:hypothetical protein
VKRFLPHVLAGGPALLVLGLFFSGHLRVFKEGPKDPVERTAEGPSAELPNDHPVSNRPPPSKDRYQVFLEPLTWGQAKRRCEELGGRLATILTEQEHDFVVSLLPAEPRLRQSFWIGLSFDGGRQRWTWGSGDVARAVRWSNGRSNAPPRPGAVAALAADPEGSRGGAWSEWESDQKVYESTAGFVCEWDQPGPSHKGPAGAANFCGRRYAYFRDKLTWFMAKSRCETMGGHLATISGKEENDFVASLLPQERDRETQYWIGLSDESRRRAWAWVTSEEFAYRNWREGEPNNAGGTEEYVAMTAGPVRALQGTWNDLEGPHRTHDVVVGYICEWEDGADASGTGRDRKAPPVYTNNGRRYALIHDGVTWSQAKAGCEKRGGRLLVLRSKEEWEFIVSKVMPAPTHQAFYWVGATDAEQEGDWRWSGGGKPGYFKWLPGEPNNFGRREHYGAILASPERERHGCLNDFEGPHQVHDLVIGYLCEFDP